jgi:hypothetical protein
MNHNAEQPDVPLIEPSKTFTFGGEIDGLNVMVSWQSKSAGIPCDLELNILVFDERVSFLFSYCFHS